MLYPACTGFSLLELLFVICIISLTYLSISPNLNRFIYQYQANHAMVQIKQALCYARSSAIAKQSSVSLNLIPFEGIKVETPYLPAKLFPIPTGKGALLCLQQSGKSANSVEVQANGMVKTNGHFTYMSINSSELPQYNLYFNKGLRVYFN